MFSSQAHLEPLGLQGKIYKILRIALCVIPVAVLIFCIYWAAITGGVWNEVVGSQVLGLSITVVILAAASCAVMVCSVMGILAQAEKILTFVYFGITVVTFLFCFILMSFGTSSMQIQSEHALADYCASNNTTNSLEYGEFCAEYWTDWSKKRYAMTRTTDAYDAFAGLVSPWIILFVVFSVMTVFIPKEEVQTRQNTEPNPPATPVKKTNEKVTVETPLMSPAADDHNVFKDELDNASQYSDAGASDYSA